MNPYKFMLWLSDVENNTAETNLDNKTQWKHRINKNVCTISRIKRIISVNGKTCNCFACMLRHFGDGAKLYDTYNHIPRIVKRIYRLTTVIIIATTMASSMIEKNRVSDSKKFSEWIIPKAMGNYYCKS